MSQNQSFSKQHLAQTLSRSGVSQEAEDALVANLDETVLLGCVGMPADDLDASEATIVAIVLDMSGSMIPHQKGVIDAYNTMTKALADAKGSTAIVISAWAFGDQRELLSGFEPAARKSKLSSAVYRPNGGTALHDAALGAMTGLVAYGQALWDSGVPTKRILVVLSDGEDNASTARASDVCQAASELSKDEAYTLAFVGFGPIDASRIAQDLGFGHALSAGASESEIRRVFRQVSESVLRQSQAATGASTTFFERSRGSFASRASSNRLSSSEFVVRSRGLRRLRWLRFSSSRTRSRSPISVRARSTCRSFGRARRH